MDPNDEFDEWDDDPPQEQRRSQIDDYISNLPKMFESIDNEVKAVVIPPNADEETKKKLYADLQTCKENVMHKILKAMEKADDGGCVGLATALPQMVVPPKVSAPPPPPHPEHSIHPHHPLHPQNPLYSPLPHQPQYPQYHQQRQYQYPQYTRNSPSPQPFPQRFPQTPPQ